MSVQRVLLAALVVWAASMASASVTPIGEFTGDVAEGFENIYPPAGYPGPIPIFGGAATLDDTLAHFVVISYVWQGPGGVVYPYNGNLFSGGVAGSELIQFNNPVTQFGGFFTTVGANPDGTIIFRGGEGEIIDTLPMTIQPAVWNWQGWSSTTPISSIEIISANVPGMSTQLDDLQATYVPEPTSLGLVALGLGTLLRRRG